MTRRPGSAAAPPQPRMRKLLGSPRSDPKGARLRDRAQPELALTPDSHPLEVANAWATCLEEQRTAHALDLYTDDAVLHVEGGDVTGGTGLLSALEDSLMHRIGHHPKVRDEDGLAVLSWTDPADAASTVEVRCRIESGKIAEQWIGAPRRRESVELERAQGPLAMSVVVRGDVSDGARGYALRQLGAVIEQIDDPVLFARIKLTRASDPALERPWIVQVSVDINGSLVRAQLAAPTMREAIDLLQGRLRDKLVHRAERRRALRKRPPSSEPGTWRHGDVPTERPDYLDRPPDERRLVRHKIYAGDEITPDEAAFDMEQQDFDFYLFGDLSSGEDALLERHGDGTYRLTRVHPVDVEPGPAAVELEVSKTPAAVLGIDDAIERLNAGGERFVFFANETTGRGTVVYRRHDGHYGLISSE